MKTKERPERTAPYEVPTYEWRLRKIPQDTMAKIKVRAAQEMRSMNQLVIDILDAAVNTPIRSK